jgi:hypothetical protein
MRGIKPLIRAGLPIISDAITRGRMNLHGNDRSQQAFKPAPLSEAFVGR